MIELFAKAIFSENLLLSLFLGMCTFLAVSTRFTTSVGLGLAVIGVQTVTVPLNHLIFTYILRRGAWDWVGLGEIDLSYLKLICFIGVIAAMVQILELLFERFASRLHLALGIFLPLITVNCAILGASLFMVERRYNLLDSAVYGLGTGIGWALAIATMAAIRERLRYSRVPDGLRGLGIAFIVTGLMSLGFSGFGGIRLP